MKNNPTPQTLAERLALHEGCQGIINVSQIRKNLDSFIDTPILELCSTDKLKNSFTNAFDLIFPFDAEWTYPDKTVIQWAEAVKKHLDFNCRDFYDQMTTYQLLTSAFFDIMRSGNHPLVTSLRKTNYMALMNIMPIPFIDFGKYFSDFDIYRYPEKNYRMDCQKQKWGPFLLKKINTMRTNPQICLKDMLNAKVCQSVYTPIYQIGDYIGSLHANRLIPFITFLLPLIDYHQMNEERRVAHGNN